MRFEELYQELERGGEMIQALAKGMTLEEARARPSPEAWSALEVICHLVDEEREDFRQRLEIILYRPKEPFPPIHPEAWVTERRYNERDMEEMLNELAAERAKSLDRVKGLAGANWETEYSNEYGSLKAGDMFAAWVAHDNLHMRQLVELRRNRLVGLAAPFDVQYAGDW